MNMQPYRITTRSIPFRGCNPCRRSPSSQSVYTVPFFPLAHSAPFPTELFRLLDNATADLIPSATARSSRPQWVNPRFDVSEVGSNYELQGELPGVDQKDLKVEFVDERTLVIRGRSVREREENSNEGNTAGDATKDAAAEPAVEETQKGKEKANYHSPAVEEEEEYVDAAAEAEGSGAHTPTTTTALDHNAAEGAETKTSKKAEPEEGSKYWVSERSVGAFERRFRFPGRVDQEGVKASLRNGILSVVVPKIVGGEPRRIEVL